METKIKGTGGHAIFLDNKLLSPSKSQKVINHSPSGFSWGYGGSGPAQLALAILLEFTDNNTALAVYQNFKWDVVANWKGPEFVAEIDIKKWIRSKIENIRRH